MPDLIEELARVIATSRGSAVVQHFHRKDAEAIAPIIDRLTAEARAKALDEAARALESDAQLCDCFARSEGECGCGAWSDYKTVPMERAVEIVRNLKGTNNG